MSLLDGWPFPPPPPDPEYIPSTAEQFLSFMLVYLLFVMGVLLVLPRGWTDWIFFRHAGKRD